MLLEQNDKHALQIQRFATKLFNEGYYKTLLDAYKAVRLALLDLGDINTKAKLNAAEKAVNDAVKNVLMVGYLDATDELNDLALYEATFIAGLMTKAADYDFSVPAKERIISYIDKALMSLEAGGKTSTATWSEFLDNQAQSVRQAYIGSIRASYLQGESVNQAVNRLRTQSEGLLKHQLEALVRTGTQHYANQARVAMGQDNKNVIAREVPVTVFDNRRTVFCTNVQLKYGESGWPIGESPIGYPPYHFGCRDSIVFLVNGQDKIEGKQPAVGGQDGEAAKDKFEAKQDRTDKKVRYRGRKDSDIFDVEQIKAGSDPEKWLRSQPRWFVESTLGKTKAALFLDGKLSISKFQDMFGRQLTLAELRQLDKKAFEEAGL